jgi:probable rRNA maturation factor
MPIHLRTHKAPSKAWLEAHLRQALRLLNISAATWDVTFVRDPDMKALHKRTMNIPTTTDVLTFDLRDNTRGTREGADVELDTVICIDEAKRRAEELGHPLRNELLLYAIHSLLHVQGYDDMTPRKAAAMHKREDELLVALGIGAVYGKPDAAASAAPKPRARRKPATR